MEPRPVLPQACPSLGADGRLTSGEEASADRLMERMQRHLALFDRIEQLSRQWIEQVSNADFDTGESLQMLLTTLETSLGPLLPDAG
ncbi:MAG: hypothetical protein ACKO22_02905 [Cyanobium sp.]